MDDIDPSEIVRAAHEGGMQTRSLGGRFFDEHFLHPKATTDAPKFIEFDWEVLRRNLGEAREELGEGGYAALSSVMYELLCWIAKGIPGFKYQRKPNAKAKFEIIGRRATALLWALDPQALDGESLRGLENALGMPAMSLRGFAADARRSFNLRNRAHDHGWNFKADKPRRKPAQRHSQKC